MKESLDFDLSDPLKVKVFSTYRILYDHQYKCHVVRTNGPHLKPK